MPSTNTGLTLLTIFEMIAMQARSMFTSTTWERFRSATISIANMPSQKLGSGNFGCICLVDTGSEVQLMKVASGSTSLSAVTNLNDDDWIKTFTMSVDWTNYSGDDIMFIGLTQNSWMFYPIHVDNAVLSALNGASVESFLRNRSFIDTVNKYGTQNVKYMSCNIPSIEQFSSEARGYQQSYAIPSMPFISEVDWLNVRESYGLVVWTCNGGSLPSVIEDCYIAFGTQGSIDTATAPSLAFRHMAEAPTGDNPETGMSIISAGSVYHITRNVGSTPEWRAEEAMMSDIEALAVNKGMVCASAFYLDSEGNALCGGLILLDGVTTTDGRDVTLSYNGFDASVGYQSASV